MHHPDSSTFIVIPVPAIIGATGGFATLVGVCACILFQRNRAVAKQRVAEIPVVIIPGMPVHEVLPVVTESNIEPSLLPRHAWP
jgi:hypothetical protein